MKIVLILSLILILPIQVFGYGISVVNISNKGWVLLDDSDTPFIMKGVCYSPTPIGKQPYNYNMFSDENKLWLVDGEYMEKMGVNTVRIYSQGKDDEACKKFIRQMYKLYSINTLFPLPLYIQGVDYSDEKIRKKIERDILNLVRKYKDTPGIVCWLIGNEVDYYFYDDKAYWESDSMTNVKSPYKRAVMRGKIIFDFVNELIARIQEIDEYHPVGISLGKTEFFNLIENHLNNADFIGLNYYQAKTFSSVWSFFKRINMPILITEFGYDAYNTKKSKEDEKTQSGFISSLWKDLYKNTFYKNNKAICLGGMVFEWSDEWWKYEYGDSRKHNVEGSWPNAAWPDFHGQTSNNVQEEWFGIFKIAKSTNEINKRIPRDIFYKLKEYWNPEVE